MRLRRGRKSMDRRCGKVIEAKPTLGQISPSEAAWAPRGQTARRLDDHLGAFDKRAAAFAAQSSVRSHQRRQNGGQRTTGFFRIFAANRIGVLEENFECEPRQLSANDSELLMPSSASLVR